VFDSDDGCVKITAAHLESLAAGPLASSLEHLGFEYAAIVGPAQNFAAIAVQPAPLAPVVLPQGVRSGSWDPPDPATARLSSARRALPERGLTSFDAAARSAHRRSGTRRACPQPPAAGGAESDVVLFAASPPLRRLGRLLHLKRLECRYTGFGIPISVLQQLAVAGNPITHLQMDQCADDGPRAAMLLDAVADFSPLETILINNPQSVTDAGFSRLGALRHLRSLGFYGNDGDDDGAAPRLTGRDAPVFTQLESIFFENASNICDGFFLSLAPCENLKRLSFGKARQLTPLAFKHLGTRTAVSQLRLSGCGVGLLSDAALDAIADAVSNLLDEFEFVPDEPLLEAAGAISDAAVARFLRRCKFLADLRLTGLRSVTFEALAASSDAAAAATPSSSSLPSLRVINLTTVGITRAGLEAIARCCPSLRRFRLELPEADGRVLPTSEIREVFAARPKVDIERGTTYFGAQ
jgi:hypothetical protein